MLTITSGCATLKPGESNFRLIGEGYASKRQNENWEDTKKRADVNARVEIVNRFENSYTAKRKYANLLGKPIDDPLVANFASYAQQNLYIIRRRNTVEAGERMAYSYAVLPFISPNPWVSGGLSVVFPGLGQLYNNTSALPHLVAGVLGAGATVYSYLQYQDWHQKYKTETKIEMINEYYDKMNNWYKYTQIAAAGYGIIVLYSSVQAFMMAQGNYKALEYIRSGGIPLSNNLKFNINITPYLCGIGLDYEFPIHKKESRHLSF